MKEHEHLSYKQPFANTPVQPLVSWIYSAKRSIPLLRPPAVFTQAGDMAGNPSPPSQFFF